MSNKEVSLVIQLFVTFSANEELLAALITTVKTWATETIFNHADSLVKQLALDTNMAHEAALDLLEQSLVNAIVTHTPVNDKW